MFGSNCLKDLGILSFLFLLFSLSAFRLWTPWIRERSPKQPRPRDVRAGSCQTLQLDNRVFSESRPRKIGWWNDGGGSLLGKRVSWIVNHLGYLVHFGGKEVVFGFVVECAYGEIRGSLVQSTCWCTNWPVTCFVWDLSAAGCWFLRCYLLFIYLDWRL